MRGVHRRAEQPQPRLAGRRRRGLEDVVLVADGIRTPSRAHQRRDVVEVLREVLDVGIVAPARRAAAIEVTGSRAGRAADAEVDAAGRRGLQQRELFGDRQRRMVGQHHAAGAQPQLRGLRGQVGDQHRRAGRRDRGHVVVLGHPVAGEAQPVGGLGQPHRGRQRVARWSGRCGRGRGRGQKAAWRAQRTLPRSLPRSSVRIAPPAGRRLGENVVEHRRGEPAGEHVLLAGVIAAQQLHVPTAARRPRRGRTSASAGHGSRRSREQSQRRLPGEPAERDDHPHVRADQPPLGVQPRRARRTLLRRRRVARRRAPHRGRPPEMSLSCKPSAASTLIGEFASPARCSAANS